MWHREEGIGLESTKRQKVRLPESQRSHLRPKRSKERPRLEQSVFQEDLIQQNSTKPKGKTAYKHLGTNRRQQSQPNKQQQSASHSQKPAVPPQTLVDPLRCPMCPSDHLWPREGPEGFIHE